MKLDNLRLFGKNSAPLKEVPANKAWLLIMKASCWLYALGFPIAYFVMPNYNPFAYWGNLIFLTAVFGLAIDGMYRLKLFWYVIMLCWWLASFLIFITHPSFMIKKEYLSILVNYRSIVLISYTLDCTFGLAAIFAAWKTRQNMGGLSPDSAAARQVSRLNTPPYPNLIRLVCGTVIIFTLFVLSLFGILLN